MGDTISTHSTQVPLPLEPSIDGSNGWIYGWIYGWMDQLYPLMGDVSSQGPLE